MASRDLVVNIIGKNEQAKRSLNEVSGLTSKFGLNTSSVSSAVAGGWAAMGTAIVAFAGKSVDTYKNVGSEILKLQRYTGGTAEETSRLRFSMQQAGIDVDSATKALGKMSKALEASPQSFTNYGIATKDAEGKTLSMHDVLLNTSDVFAKMPNGAEKTAMALKLFGKSGADMIPFLNRGKSGIEDLEKQTDKYGLTLSGKNLDDIKKSKEAQRQLTAAVQGLQVELGQKLLPTITDTTSRLADLTAMATKLPNTFDSANKSSHGFLETLLGASPALAPLEQFKQSADYVDKFGKSSKKAAVDVASIAAATGDSTDKIQAFIDSQKETGITYTSTSDALQAYKEDVAATTDATEAATTAADNAWRAQQSFGTMVDNTNNKLNEAKTALDDATQKLNGWFDTISGHLDLEAKYQQSIDDLTDSIKQNGATTDLNTQKGRDNLKAIEDVKTAILEKSLAHAKETGDVNTAIQDANLYTASLELQLQKLGFTKKASQDYVAQLGLTPASITTAFTQSGLQKGMDDVSYFTGQVNALNGRTINVSLQLISQGQQLLSDALLASGHDRTDPYAHASGGMLNEGFNLINEQGPELLEKRGPNVMVHTAAQTALMVSHGGTRQDGRGLPAGPGGMSDGRPLVVNLVLDGQTVGSQLIPGVRVAERALS